MSATPTRMLPVSADVTTKLRTLRKEQRLSALALADSLRERGYHVTRSTIATYEILQADTVPLDYAAAAATVLGTSLVALLTGPAPCLRCNGFPPAGFTCNACGGAAAEGPLQYGIRFADGRTQPVGGDRELAGLLIPSTRQASGDPTATLVRRTITAGPWTTTPDGGGR